MNLTDKQFEEIQKSLNEAMGRLIVIPSAREALELVRKAGILLDDAYNDSEK